ncbi:unknown protein [Desulfotalea psychrophila LSv54]|uniref:Uncharacterized protein n=2 Tax=Desulfotalea psychrophila TaxID=84980 RepID=Q6AKE6_DESPS|nr:unknown protein [Desulfotalea psychrophila LSv54]
MSSPNPRVNIMSKKNMVSLEEEDKALSFDGEVRSDMDITRRKFIQYSTVLLAGVALPMPLVGCASKNAHWSDFDLPRYEIDTVVQTTQERMIAFNMNLAEVPPKGMEPPPMAPDGKSDGLAVKDLHKVSEYQSLGYGSWSYGSGLPRCSPP